jgi:hypothetical protein
MLRYAGVSLFALAALGLMGCGDDQPPETPPPAPPDPVAPVPVTPDPVPPPVPTVQTGPCDAQMTLSLKTAIEGRGPRELSGNMKAEGAFRCEWVAEGGKISVPVTVQQGCYTFLAHSFPNVTELNVYLKPNLGPNPTPPLSAFANQVIGEDSETGPTGAIGKAPNCFKNPLPIPFPMVVEVVAQSGAGPIAVQVYSK